MLRAYMYTVALRIQTSPHRSLSHPPRHLSYPVPLLSASPQGFCAPPRNVIFPLAASCRLPIFTEAIIAHRSSGCPFGSSPVVPLFLAVHRPYIGSPLGSLPRLDRGKARAVENGDEEAERERGGRAMKPPSFSPFVSSFTPLALCLASIFALTKRSRFCIPTREWQRRSMFEL